MTDPRWTDDTLAMVAAWNEHYDHATKEKCLTCRVWAQGLLTALADVGILIPPGSEVREEFGFTSAGITWTYRSEDQARMALSPATAIRKRTVHTEPWQVAS